ncbi:MAG: heavy-metal-associated domain-containing protein [Bacteroidales bacterium]|nr:heavy-metal-associated domain-containing protein [Bacteroidales bacterium]MBP5537373.1 heavy-metal-associated domain-containing protein [Bacteroidales bacterium]MBP5796604.1 heavy-metal-associated domain-containing protein [Bacteroidales bacterium]
MKKLLNVLLSVILLASSVAFASQAKTSVSGDKKPKDTVTVIYNVNIHCENCVEKLTDKLSFLKGMEDLNISLSQKTVVIKYDPAKTDEATLVKAIEKCGYTAEKVNP